jgi:hypothetical protein
MRASKSIYHPHGDSNDFTNVETALDALDTALDALIVTVAAINSYASQSDAETGTDNAKIMTALRVNQAIAKWGHAPDVIIEDQKSQNTAGGTATSGSWATRTLNTLVRNNGTLASLSSNQFTLPAGSYYISWSAPAYYCNYHQTRLQNITDTTTAGVGTSAHSGNAVADTATTRSCGAAVVTLAASKAFEIQHQVTVTRATDGFGVAANFTTEVYGRVEITKVA